MLGLTIATEARSWRISVSLSTPLFTYRIRIVSSVFYSARVTLFSAPSDSSSSGSSSGSPRASSSRCSSTDSDSVVFTDSALSELMLPQINIIFLGAGVPLFFFFVCQPRHLMSITRVMPNAWVITVLSYNNIEIT